MPNLARVLLSRNQSRLSSTAFQDETQTIDYATLERQSQQFAGWLSRQGLQPGDRVGILLPDSVDTVIAFLGTVLAGGIAVMISPQGRTETIEYKIKHTSPCVVLRQDNIKEILAQSRQFPPNFTVAGNNKDPAFMLWTSGTTGHPKAVVHSHDNVFAHCVGVTELSVMASSQDRIYSTAKLSFAYGIIHVLFGTMWAGACAFLDSGLAVPGRVCNNIQQFKPSIFFSVPVIYSQLVSRLKVDYPIKFVSSGDRLPDALLTRWRQVIGQPIYNSLGTSECLTSFLFNHDGTTSVGQPVPMYQTRIVDGHGNTVPAGQVGHLQVKAPSAGLGYWNDEYWTAQYFKDWITTGDSCYQDQLGNLYHMGRIGDVIKIAGHFINPKELEETLESYPGVEQAAVVSIPNEHGVERIEAYVVGTATSRELRHWMHKHHDRQQCPRKVHIVQELPRTDTGKIQRYKLREQI